jgi:hypothetical protein
MASWNVFESSAKTIPLTSVGKLERRSCLILSLPQQWLSVAYEDTGDAGFVTNSRKSGSAMDPTAITRVGNHLWSMLRLHLECDSTHERSQFLAVVHDDTLSVLLEVWNIARASWSY